MDASIIIVSYNSASFLEKCIESIINSQNYLDIEVIVVDNASTDGSVELIKSNFTIVKLIRNDLNFGFAKGNNIGISAAKGEYVLFLNPDTILCQDTLSKMVNFMKNTPDAGALGPKLIYPNSSLQLSCRHFYNLRTIFLRRTILGKIFPNSRLLRYHLMSDWDHNTTQEVDWVLGACLMVPRKVLEKVGYFDEKYKMYFEDVDLCYRIKKAGYKVYYYPGATVIHHHQRESAKKFSMKTIWHIQSAIRFFNKFGWKI